MHASRHEPRSLRPVVERRGTRRETSGVHVWCKWYFLFNFERFSLSTDCDSGVTRSPCQPCRMVCEFYSECERETLQLQSPSVRTTDLTRVPTTKAPLLHSPQRISGQLSEFTAQWFSQREREDTKTPHMSCSMWRVDHRYSLRVRVRHS